MNVIPFVHEGLGNSSYLVDVGDGEAALVDPDRSVDRYLAAAQDRGWTVTSVFDTHLHADFISGARELAARLDARLYLPADGAYRFEHTPVRPGQIVTAGAYGVEAVASPGHTPEHLSYVFRATGEPPALFSGGALIVGGAARTDLVSPDLTDSLTQAQFHTVREAFTSLRDETLLYPTHGAGSFCSAGGGGQRTSTLGQEREQNPLFSFDDEEEFAHWFLSTFPAAPDYFFRMRAFNQGGPRLRRDIPMPPALSPEEFDAARSDALVVDVRPVRDYTGGHIPGSLSIMFRDVYAVWLGWLVPPETPLLFVTGKAPIEAVVDQSLLVGYERFAGWLPSGIEGWAAAGKPVRGAELVDGAGARKLLADGFVPLDVREPDEYEAGHLPDAVHIPLGQLGERVGELPRDRPVLVYCAHGPRASSGLSLLEARGFAPLANLVGGFGAWQEAELEAAR